MASNNDNTQRDRSGLSYFAKRGIFGLQESLTKPVVPKPRLSRDLIPLSPMAHRRISRERIQLLNDPPAGIQLIAALSEFRWLTVFDGPKDTPYQGGRFKVIVTFLPNYPSSPPGIRFGTKIFHCNVCPTGGMGARVVAKDWSPLHNVRQVLDAVKGLLVKPNLEKASEPYVANVLKYHPKHHDFNARMWTKLYAKPEQALLSVVD